MTKYSLHYLIGVTGTFGAGKNLVGSILSENGVFVIDVDDIVRTILSDDNSVTKKIIQRFGTDLQSHETGEFIDRKKLASLIFLNPDDRKYVEDIIHPEVFKVLKSFISSNSPFDLIVILIPLLFEASSNLKDLFNEIWCVTCNEEILVQRLLKNGYSVDDVMKRINSQYKQEEKLKRADSVIDNSFSQENTKKQVNELLEKVRLKMNHVFGSNKP